MTHARSAALVLVPLFLGTAQAQEPHHHDHSHVLHFTHPLIAESVSPDTKLRLDFARAEPAGHVAWELEGEYAFAPSFSLEIGTHYEADAQELGTTHLTAKFATYGLGERGILLGFGAGLGIPTSTASAPALDHHDEVPHEHEEEAGHGHGDVWEITPFLTAGLRSGPWELIGWAKFTHGFESGDRPATNHASYNAGLLLHASAVAQPLLELHGVAFGDETVAEVAYLTPSLRVVPFAGRGLAIGAGVTLPLGGDRGFDSQLALSAFWHF